METVWEIVKFVLPSALVLIAVWILINYFLKTQNRQKEIDLKLASQRKTIPLQLQAYERLAVFLERKSLDMLLVRETNPSQSARDFHQHLVETIRSEFEHNLSQQIYISDESWKVIRMAKENTIKMINAALQQVDHNGPSLDLSKQILDFQIEAGVSPAQAALTFLKADAKKLL